MNIKKRVGFSIQELFSKSLQGKRNNTQLLLLPVTFLPRQWVVWPLKKNFMAPFYGSGSTASRLEPVRGGSLLFTAEFSEIPDTHFIDLGRMKG